MAVYGINYDDGNKKNLGYESVRVSYGENQKKIFNSGNFVKDWFDLMKFIINELSETEFHFSASSSVDHFIMDGAPYDSAYLHMVNEKPVLKYVDKTKENYLYEQQDVYEDGTEFFVPEGTQPTWEELKEMCK